MRRLTWLTLASSLVASLSGVASAQANFNYGFEGLANGPVVGQDGWGIQAGGKGDGANVVNGGSPAGGGAKSLALNPMNFGPNTRVWRNTNDPLDITAGKWLMTFDFTMLPYAGSPSFLLRVRPDGRNNDFNAQVFQAGMYQSSTATEVPAFFIDPDGIGGATPYQGLYWFDNTYGIMSNNNWYRVQYIMDYDANTVEQELIFDVNSGTPTYLGSAYDALQTSPNGAFVGWFNSNGVNYYDATGSFMIGCDDSPSHSTFDGGRVDNIGMVRLANVTGNIDFNGYGGDLTARDCRISWYDSSGNITFVNYFRTDASGNYSIWCPTGTNLTPAVECDAPFVLWFWLNKRFGSALTIPNAGMAGVNFVLKTGDANRDNAVDIGDFSLLSSSYGLFAGDPGYDTNCDFTGDDAVDIGDYALLSSNFGEFGD